MNWINTVVRPKIRSMLNRRDAPENLWIKCPVTGEMVFHRDLENNQFVVPNSDYHMRLNATQRFGFLFDDGDYTLIDLPEAAMDPLKFRDTKRYTDRMRDARAKTGKQDSISVAQGNLEGLRITAAVQDFTFLGGSLGMAAGEALITGILRAVEDRTPFVLFTASGGARMQEGILSLMQMPRTTVALQALRDEGLPYILVLTDPTTGGVTASYAMLGDIQLAEPGALIGFAGQRVIEQTIREKLPEGFQRAEYLKEHGMVDMVVHRHDLPSVIARLCRFFTNTDKPEAKQDVLPDETEAQDALAPELEAAEETSETKDADGEEARDHVIEDGASIPPEAASSDETDKESVKKED